MEVISGEKGVLTSHAAGSQCTLYSTYGRSAYISAAEREPPSRYKVPPALQAAHADPPIQSTVPNYRVVPKVPVSPLNTGRAAHPRHRHGVQYNTHRRRFGPETTNSSKTCTTTRAQVAEYCLCRILNAHVNASCVLCAVPVPLPAATAETTSLRQCACRVQSCSAGSECTARGWRTACCPRCEGLEVTESCRCSC
eukprot:COSAG02_NODE_2508_length_8634_cov_2.849326_7_plen_196_part_00